MCCKEETMHCTLDFVIMCKPLESAIVEIACICKQNFDLLIICICQSSSKRCFIHLYIILQHSKLKVKLFFSVWSIRCGAIMKKKFKVKQVSADIFKKKSLAMQKFSKHTVTYKEFFVFSPLPLFFFIHESNQLPSHCSQHSKISLVAQQLYQKSNSVRHAQCFQKTTKRFQCPNKTKRFV